MVDAAALVVVVVVVIVIIAVRSSVASASRSLRALAAAVAASDDEDDVPLVTIVSTERDGGHYELTGTGDTLLVPHRPGEGWRHIALVAGDGPRGAIVYLDGEPVEQGGSWRDSSTMPKGLVLGGKFASAVTGGINAIDELLIYRGRLSRERVAELAAR